MTFQTAAAKARKLSRITADHLAYVVYDETAGEIDRTFEPYAYGNSEDVDTFYNGCRIQAVFDNGEVSE